MDRFKVGISPQHVVPSWDLQTPWAANNGRPGIGGSLAAIDTRTGEARKILVGLEPHGLTVWPQTGRYSLGHTGNMR